MAIDTRDKRASAVGVGLPWRRVGPVPDGSLASAADRRQLAGCYAGLAAGGGPGPPADIPETALTLGFFTSTTLVLEFSTVATHVRLAEQFATNSYHNFRLELTDLGEAWNLTGATVTAFFRAPNDGGTVEVACAAVDAAGGVFLAAVGPDDWGDAGEWTVDVRVVDSAGKTYWWPYTVSFRVRRKAA